MKILLDNCVDWRLRRSLPSHQVLSTREMEWDDLENGELLAEASKHFEVLLTVDQNMKYQRNLSNLPLSVVVLVSKSSRLAHLIRLVPAVEETLKNMAPRTLVEVQSPIP